MGVENVTDESKQILVAITELQTNVKNMNSKMDEISKISTLTHEMNQSVKSAHNRIDDVKADTSEKLSAQKQDYVEKLEAQEKVFEKLSDNITWLWRAVATALIGLLFKFFVG